MPILLRGALGGNGGDSSSSFSPCNPRDAIEINASGSDGTTVIDSSCNVIVVNVDGVTQTLEFPDPSLIPAEGVQDYSIYVVPTNGGVVRFKMVTGFSWVNTGLDSFDVNILSTVTARMHNTTSYTGGLIQVDPLNTTAPTRDGIGDYNDTSTSATPLTLTADTWTDIPNDGLGAFTNLNFLPSDVTQLIDTTTGYLDLTELNFGDTVFIRNDYSVTPSTNNSLLTLRYVLGTGLGEYTLEKVVGRLDSGSGQPYRFSLTPDMIYVGDSNTKDNPVKLQVKLSTNGTLVNAGSAIGVVRR